MTDSRTLAAPQRRHCLNLGCGKDIRICTEDEDWVNVDRNTSENERHDIRLVGIDLDKGNWGKSLVEIYDGPFDYAIAKHLVEHISDLHAFMENLWIAMKPGGIVDIIAPYYTHQWAWGDPDHKRAITENTFMFYSQEARDAQPADSPMTILPGKANFRVLEIRRCVNEEAVQKLMGTNESTPEQRVFAATHFFNVVDEISFKLEAVK